MAEKVTYAKSRLEILNAPAWIVPCKGAFILTGRAMLVYVAIVVIALAVGIGAGWTWRDREARHLTTVGEITEIQGRILERLDKNEMRSDDLAEKLAVFQACAESAGKEKVRQMVITLEKAKAGAGQ